MSECLLNGFCAAEVTTQSIIILRDVLLDSKGAVLHCSVGGVSGEFRGPLHLGPLFGIKFLKAFY